MRVAVLTSGGDSPGMNAAVRTVAMVGWGRGHEVLGVRRGYTGLLDGDVVALERSFVDGISRHGGTVLGSTRSAEFPTPAGQAKAKEKIQKLGIDALVVVGGNGSLAGAHLLDASGACRVVGIPASIDNDVGHTSLAIGTDTAVNTIVEACDRISDTARAHCRAFVIEVMGRHCGFLAMRAGIAAEANAILFAEKNLGDDQLVAKLKNALRSCFAETRVQKRALILKAEGVRMSTQELVTRLEEAMKVDVPGIEVRGTVLGHIVRGGSPSAMDRLVAQRLAYGAVHAVEGKHSDVMMAWEPPGGGFAPTNDPSVSMVPL
ncbi:MAG: 6-phosphofructokinase, partial [Polyangiaceae bacterium]